MNANLQKYAQLRGFVFFRSKVPTEYFTCVNAIVSLEVRGLQVSLVAVGVIARERPLTTGGGRLRLPGRRLGGLRRCREHAGGRLGPGSWKDSRAKV